MKFGVVSDAGFIAELAILPYLKPSTRRAQKEVFIFLFFFSHDLNPILK